MTTATAAADPTLTLLRELDDPAKYVVVRNVPVFCEHEATKTGPDGKRRKVAVTARDVAEIVRNMRRLAGGPKVLQRITLGHTLRDPEAPEPDQPEPVGWARDPREGRWDGKAAVFCDLYLARERAAEARTYPYRSAEYYAGRKEITGVALLRRDPELDLGVLTFTRGPDDGPYFYAMENGMADGMGDPTLPLDDVTMPPADDGYEQARGHIDRYMGECYPRMAEMHQRYMDDNPAVEEAPPGGDLPPGGAPPPDDLMTPMQRSAAATRYARAEAENKSLRRELNETKARAAVAELTGAGFIIPDVEAEVRKQAGLSERDRAARCDEIRTCYQKDPTFGDPVQVASATARPEVPLTVRELSFADQYMRDHAHERLAAPELWARAEAHARKAARGGR